MTVTDLFKYVLEIGRKKYQKGHLDVYFKKINTNRFLKNSWQSSLRG